MIKTKFGTPVEIISAATDKNGTWLTVRLPNGETREWSMADFRADSGAVELFEAVRKVQKGVEDES